MIGFLKSIFKGKVDAQKAFNDTREMIDNINFTNEERSVVNMEIARGQIEYAKSTASENTLRSKTRRFIAIAIIMNVLAVFWLCVTMVIMEKGIEPILELVGVFQLGWAFLTVIAFFFGGYYYQNYKQKEKKIRESQ